KKANLHCKTRRVPPCSGIFSMADCLSSGPTSSMTQQRDLIVTLPAKYRLSVYPSFAFASALLAYGANSIGQYRRAASYIDRNLKGEKPANLPVGRNRRRRNRQRI